MNLKAEKLVLASAKSRIYRKRSRFNGRNLMKSYQQLYPLTVIVLQQYRYFLAMVKMLKTAKTFNSIVNDNANFNQQNSCFAG
jgi:hypothetical protein